MPTDPQFLILAPEHPQDAFGGVGLQIAAGFMTLGIAARCLVLPRDRLVLESLATDQVSGILALGSHALATSIAGQPIWRRFPCPVTIHLLDSILYDLARARTLPAFLTDAIGDPRLGLASPEDGHRRWLGELLPVRWNHLPYASFMAPGRPADATATPGSHEARPLRSRLGEAAGPRNNRLCVIGNVGRELGDSPAGEGLNTLLRRKLGSMIPANGQRELAEALRSPDAEIMPAQTFCRILQISPDRALRSDLLPIVIAIDSWVRRDRRLRAMRSAAGLEVDFFGTGWQALLGDVRDFRHLGQIGADEIVVRLGQYRGLINFDPNWTHGVHGRVYTALDAGAGVLTQDNAALSATDGLGQRLLSYDPRRPALAERLAGHSLQGEAPALRVPRWSDRLRDWLNDLDPALRPPAAGASTGASYGPRTHPAGQMDLTT